VADKRASSPPDHGQGARRNDCDKRIAGALVLLGVEPEHSHLRWKFIWRSGRGDVVVTALSPASGRHVLHVQRADDRDVHPRLVELVADRVREELARVGLHRALRDVERDPWPDGTRGGRR
jgi:hypothetical protein